MALTALEVSKAKAKDKPYKMADGDGMYLLVQPTGAKYWRMDYRLDGKRKTLAMGTFPDVSLIEARANRGDAHKLLKNGTDPSGIKKVVKQAKEKILQIAENTFRNLATEFHKVKSPMWTEGHAKQWLGNLEKYALPTIGDKPIADIESMDIMQISSAIALKARIFSSPQGC